MDFRHNLSTSKWANTTFIFENYYRFHELSFTFYYFSKQCKRNQDNIKKNHVIVCMEKLDVNRRDKT